MGQPTSFERYMKLVEAGFLDRQNSVEIAALSHSQHWKPQISLEPAFYAAVEPFVFCDPVRKFLNDERFLCTYRIQKRRSHPFCFFNSALRPAAPLIISKLSSTVKMIFANVYCSWQKAPPASGRSWVVCSHFTAGYFMMMCFWCKVYRLCESSTAT